MIRNLIFDFGNIFVDLDTEATVRTLLDYGVQEIPSSLYEAALNYEKGQLSTNSFVQTAMELLPGLSEVQLIDAWNAILLDIPPHRLKFLKELVDSNSYGIFLLSNSNTLHIEHLTQRWGKDKMQHFLSHFNSVYFSHEIGMRKPDEEIFHHVIEAEGIRPGETLFIDDMKENTDAAAQLGIHTWHLKAGSEDISELQAHLP